LRLAEQPVEIQFSTDKEGLDVDFELRYQKAEVGVVGLLRPIMSGWGFS
jgi:hypothetical protein